MVSEKRVHKHPSTIQLPSSARMWVPLAGRTPSLPDVPHGTRGCSNHTRAGGFPAAAGFACSRDPAEQKQAGVAAWASGNPPCAHPAWPSQSLEVGLLSPITVLHVLGSDTTAAVLCSPRARLGRVGTLSGFSRLVLGRSPLPLTQAESSAHPGTRR